MKIGDKIQSSTLFKGWHRRIIFVSNEKIIDAGRLMESRFLDENGKTTYIHEPEEYKAGSIVRQYAHTDSLVITSATIEKVIVLYRDYFILKEAEYSLKHDAWIVEVKKIHEVLVEK
jgi:hypothetical protein